MVVPPGDSIQTDFSHSASKSFCAPEPITHHLGLGNLDTPAPWVIDVFGLFF